MLAGEGRGSNQHGRARSVRGFFFFQAEDGIRDHCVTGVQTCALPISAPCGGAGERRAYGVAGESRLHRYPDAARWGGAGGPWALSPPQCSTPGDERQRPGGHMSGSKSYDLAVIGSGTAAQVASTRVRAAGWSVAVIDHLPFGGTCALRGCDPKKMLISGAEAIDMDRRSRGRGAAGELGLSWPELIAFKRTFTDPVPANHEWRYAEHGIAAFHGKARFTGRD